MANFTTGDEYDRANGESGRVDRLVDKAGRRFLRLAEKLPEDASSLGSFFGRRYEVRVLDVGGRGLARPDQKVRRVLTTKSAAEAKAMADETGGTVWDRKIAYMIYEGGAAPEAKRKRETRDGGTWGWFGTKAEAGEEEPPQ